MSLSDFTALFPPRIRIPILVVILMAGCAWGVLGAIRTFTAMVDERSIAIVKAASAGPLAEHEDFKRRLARHDQELAAILAGQLLMHDNLTRLMALREQDERNRNRGERR